MGSDASTQVALRVADMLPKSRYAADAETRQIPSVFSPVLEFVLMIRDDAIRGAKAIDRLLDWFYLPAEVQAHKKKLACDKGDPIRLHGLGVRW